MTTVELYDFAPILNHNIHKNGHKVTTFVQS